MFNTSDQIAFPPYPGLARVYARFMHKALGSGADRSDRFLLPPVAVCLSSFSRTVIVKAIAHVLGRRILDQVPNPAGRDPCP